MKKHICVECVHEDESRCTNTAIRNKYCNPVTGIPKMVSCNIIRNKKDAWYKKLFHSKFNCSQYIARGKII